MAYFKLNYFALIILLIISSCKLLEPSYPPKYRVQNYCDYVVDFKIIPAGTDTIRFDNVQNNTSGNFVDIKEGNVNVIVFVQGNSEIHTKNFVASKDRKYTVAMHDGAVFGQHYIHLDIIDEPH